MGYLHVPNLYQDQRILAMRECYALEKVHGTSANVAWRDGHVWFSSGGENAVRFAAVFDEAALAAVFRDLGYGAVTVFGEAYGATNAQAWRYGDTLRFVAFDVQADGRWLDVPAAETLAKRLGLRFVHYVRVPTDIATLDAERDAPSEEARRNGVDGVQPREGVVLRPVLELTDADGQRIIAKHKRDEERETATPRKVVDTALQAVLTEATAIAAEWVTVTRLEHVLDKLPQGLGIAGTKDVIAAMVADVVREAKGEIVDSKEARAAIGKRAAVLFHAGLKGALR